MIFSSNIFLFLYLPTVLIVYYLFRIIFRSRLIDNLILVALSLFFLFWGTGWNIVIFITIGFLNFVFGLIIQLARKQLIKKIFLVFGLSANLFPLIYYKYFTTSLMPLGLSFYTFGAISYLVDSFRRKIGGKYNIVDFFLFFSFFPKLIQGPIVRFSEIKEQIKTRDYNIDNFFDGIWFFARGLGQKVILANSFGTIVDKIFSLPQNQINFGISWLGAILFTFQIYYDFAGYSNMAIGLGKFFGFKLPQNFNLPYISRSLTEFWRRWHITLSSWLRDYLYIPLGGNRHGIIRTCFNLLIVFVLAGIWHGKGKVFVVWGIFHGVILIIERLLKYKFNYEPRGIFAQFITFLLLIFSWVIFRSPSVRFAFFYIKIMLGLTKISVFQYYHINYFLQTNYLFYLIIAFIFAFFSFKRPRSLFIGLISILLIVCSSIFLAKTSFKPFLYFQF